jgi:MAF protein
MTSPSPTTAAKLPRLLVLASTSPFRRALLERIGLGFETSAPDVDERAHAGESPEALVMRLAQAKARTGGAAHPDALIIGSDQIACIDGEILGKPGSRERAIAQLEKASGRKVTFYTGLCLLDSGTDRAQVECIPFHVHFRDLSRRQIEGYVDREQPLNCAGSFKSEGLGIALFRRLEGDDPNALIGLPLIRLVSMLATVGVDPLLPAASGP